MAFIFETLALDIGALTALILAVIYVYFKRSFAYWKTRQVPYLEPSFPFGNFRNRFISNRPIGHAYQDIYKKLEGKRYGGTYLFSKPEFLFLDPELIKCALVKDFSHFHDRGIHLNEELNPLQAHLFFLPGQKWRNLRVKLSPTFTSGKMKMMLQTLIDCGIELGSTLEEPAKNGQVLEIKDILARYSTDIISSCAFGIQSNSLKNPEAEFRQWGRRIFSPTARSFVVGILNLTFPAVLDNLKIPIADKDVTKYFIKMVTETVKYREDNNVKRNDFMQLLIQLKNKGVVEADDDADHNTEVKGHNNEVKDHNNEVKDHNNVSAENGLPMKSLAAQAFVFFLAGFETSSTTMTFCLYELAVNPNIQERLRDEVNSVLMKHDGKITYDSITEMEYLDKVVSETLRKYPPVPNLNREVTKEYKVPESDVVLQKGTATVIPVWALHHDPKYYPQPERFDPERFSEEEKANRHQYVYLPFGEGPRICIGMRFGLMQTKIGIISLLSKFRFSVSEKTPIPLVFEKKSIILSPVGGMWLKINKC